MKQLGVLLMLLLTGCTSLSTMNLKPADAAQTTPPPASNDSTAAAKPKIKQWHTTETPETLPKDKLDKMSLGGGGFGGY